MRKGNKGEWSEIYVLLRLLGDGRIYAADENLNKIESVYFPILKIIREREHKEYEITKQKIIRVFFNGQKIREVSSEEFSKEADKLYEQLIQKHSGSFSVEYINYITEDVDCYGIKAGTDTKADITLQIHDICTGYNPICGFSIKSEIGDAPTLINASKATNFIYKIKGVNPSIVNQINEIKSKTKIIDRINRILSVGGTLSYYKMNNDVFRDNLVFIDSLMPNVLGEALKIFYMNKVSECNDVIKILADKNPMKYPRPDVLYTYKFKKFLCSAALGMMPSKSWSGIDEANGGYIISKKDGEVLAYYIYNRDAFENYLLRNTKFEKASTSRHDFATIYSKNDELFMNLNLQIRFI